MKKITLIILSAVIFMACSKEDIESSYENDGIEVDRIIDEEPEEPTTNVSVELTAGQHYNVGAVSVSASATGTTISYDTSGDWVILETHLYVGPLADVPSTGSGNPKIGHFPLKGEHEGSTTSVTYQTDTIETGTCEVVFAHAVVVNTATGQEETAWGAGFEAPGNNWAMYFEVCN